MLEKSNYTEPRVQDDGVSMRKEAGVGDAGLFDSIVDEAVSGMERRGPGKDAPVNRKKV